MLDINKVVSFLETYKMNDKFTYHKKCIEKLKKVEKNKINRIQSKPYILYGLRLYLLNSIDSYKFVLSKYKYKNCSYYKISLNDKEKDNFLMLIELMEKKKSNLLKLGEIDITLIKSELDIKDKVYLNIIDVNEPKKIKNYIEIKNYYDTLSYLLNIESKNLLKYQRLDRMLNFLKDPEALKVYEIFQSYNDMIHSLNFEERDKYIILSGTVLQSIGTTYTRDVDVMIFKPESEQKDVKEIIKNIHSKYDKFDLNIIDKYGEYHTTENDIPLKYKKIWLTYQLPRSGGADDIYELLLNPTHHFYFCGVKLFGLNLTINRFLQRASISSMADLLMLKEINNYDVSQRLCLPNLTIRQGIIKVFYGKYLEVYFKTLQKALKLYYNKDYTIEQLKKEVKHCNAEGFDIYKGEIIKDPDTDIIKFFHILIKKDIIKRNASNCKYLLDVGTGKLTDMRIWDENNIKNVVGIEPSVDSLKMGEERIKKFGFKGSLQLINGVGDDDWTLNEKYKVALSNKYDVVTFQFTLHYMMNNIQTVISNLKKVMLPKCKIIITCMDGNKIQRDFNKYGHVEIRNKQEPIFAIFPMYKVNEIIPEKDNNIIVYFKGAYGVSSGSIEPIIDIDRLIDIFKQNGINLLERKNFSDYDIDLKRKLFPPQLKVSSYYISLLFQYE